MKPFYQLLLAIGLLLLLFFAGFYFGHRNAEKNAPEPQVDTVTIRDTITDYEPIPATTPAGWELVPSGIIKAYELAIDAYKDSLERKPTIVAGKDSSTYIAIPISQNYFTDHQTYECVVTGYETKMLWHKSFRETNYITKTTKIPTLPKIAISPDFSALVSKDIFFLGAGVKLDVWAGNWRFSPGLDYGLTWTGGQWSHGPAFTFSTNYNFIIR